MKKGSKIYVAGGQSGLVGTAIVRLLKKKGYNNIIVKPREEVNVLNQESVEKFFQKYKPEYVFLAAAKVGGIWANKTQKADFIFENLQIQTNVIYHAWKHKVKKLLFLGSSCIYPKYAPQPIKEEYLLSGKLEETNDAYAVAKIAGITLCQSFNEQYKTDFISAMPASIYGPGDNFDSKNSHVIPGLMRKFHEAKIAKKKKVVLWGTGKAYREFLYVDDLAEASVLLMNHYRGSEIINIGVGKDLSIKELASIIKRVVGYKGSIAWDHTKPDGTPRKLLDISKAGKLGWQAKVPLARGLQAEYVWFLKNYEYIK